ncbi:hypothetical protein CLOM_g24671 [Closterium sp. NIES-68]|nr:hypothetical protein CLOM_g24671 [Closterium sp. NIES-68]GJP70522.1 hypothetical protein CLOP_g1455 [Closterium sp. NIES-67]
MPEAPVALASSLTAFRHALVCKRWLRVARSVHPAIVVPRNRFFSARTFASLLSSPTLGFPNLRHLHLGEFAMNSVDSRLVRSICDGCGSSLTHLTMHLYGRQPVTSMQSVRSSPAEQSTGSAAILPADVAAIFSSCTRLVNLDLRLGLGVCEIPPSISCLEKLTRLSMSFSNVTALPGELLSLCRLKELHLVSQSLRMLPNPFSCLTSLEHLSLRNCPMGHLPRDLGHLHNIKILSLSHLPGLAELPDSICQLPALSRLSLDHCPRFVRLPENLFQLPSLDTLHLDKLPAFTALPISFGQLPPGEPVASSPTIHTCPSLSSLPEDIGRLSALEYLYLKFVVRLTALPNSLGHLTALKELKAVECANLEVLPDSVSAMGALTSLILDGCFFADLPSDIGQLQNLDTLKLFSTRLSDPPDSFGQLGSLKKLTLYECYDLVELPASFTNLTSLETLLIYGGSSLMDLPLGFEKLSQLRRLELLNCSMPYLPDRFGELANLEILKVQSTDTYKRFGITSETVPPAAHLGYQSEGEEFQLDGSCSLQGFPPSFSSLTRLQQLIIDGCEMLEELPEGMGNLASLRVLKVENCKRLRVFPSLLPTAISTTATGPCTSAATSSSAAPPPLPLLEELVISCCPKLTNLPQGLDLLPRLEHFTLEYCTSSKLANRSTAVSLSASSSPPSPLVAPITLPRSVESIIISNVFKSAHYLPESFLSLSCLLHLNIYDLRSLKQLIAPPALAQTPAEFETDDIAASCAGLEEIPRGPIATGLSQLDLLSSLVHLHIVNTNLPSLPDNLGDLRELAVLQLEKCHAMTSLPDSLTTLSKLQQIDLKSLPLLTHLPENFGQLKALNELSLESCKALQGLPSSFTLLPSLIMLSIINCPKVTCLPDSLSSFTRLSSLKLNRLPGLRHLPSPFFLPSLVQFSLQGCKRLCALPNDLGGLSHLREVDLDGCPQLKQLPQSLRDRQKVIEVKGAWGRRR